MSNDFSETALLADRLIAKQFGDAPRELKDTVLLARNALQKRNKGFALKELRAAEKILKNHPQIAADWQAELYAAWAYFHFLMDEEAKMYQALSRAIRLEPENALIAELRELLGENGK
ncbi:MAG: hypothetical protein KC449_05460 [Anaerolineales bacterium]|nr:hypothetical protein [Anaerolineales bacterium]MCB8939242.1 hypothetical protein [Ardenticatenaceae bacterium]